jgi:hypothetical protein
VVGVAAIVEVFVGVGVGPKLHNPIIVMLSQMIIAKSSSKHTESPKFKVYCICGPPPQSTPVIILGPKSNVS